MTPEKSPQPFTGETQVLGPMHEQVALPRQPVGMVTQWNVLPGRPAEYDTQVWSGPVQAAQLLTLLHWVAGTQPPV